MDDIVDSIANAALSVLGMEGTSLLTVFIFVSMLSQLAARLIPDDSTGWLATLKKVCSVIGLYASNRVSSGITVNDIVKEVGKVQQDVYKPEVQERVDERIEEGVASNAEDTLDLTPDMRFKPPFPGLSNRKRDPETGEFLPIGDSYEANDDLVREPRT